MPRENLDDYLIAKTLYAYLVESKSHREIQREILNMPAPARGGGFEAMKILHNFDLKEDAKGILGKGFDGLENLNGRVQEIIKTYLSMVEEAESRIGSKRINPANRATDRFTTVKARVFQDELKKFVASNYNNCCALCNNDQPELLVASHIVPWSSSENKRLDLDNCLLLCNFHDKLFDKGFIALDDDYHVIVSDKLRPNVATQLTTMSFKNPRNDKPSQHNLRFHRENIFRK